MILDVAGSSPVFHPSPPDRYWKGFFMPILKKAGVTNEIHKYEEAQHGFNNDPAPTRYNEEAAKLAWERTRAFFKKNIG